MDCMTLQGQSGPNKQDTELRRLHQLQERTMRLPRPPPDVTAYSEANTCTSRSDRGPSNAVRIPNSVSGSAQQHRE